MLSASIPGGSLNLIKLLLKVVAHVLRTITYGWILDTIGIFQRAWATARDLWAGRGLHHADRERSVNCVTTDHPSVRRPDPCIYSQHYLMQQGLPVTWDNPDIVIRRAGAVVSENELLPATTYEVEVTIWNNSYDAPVVGLEVALSFLSFGVGTTSTPIGSTVADVGVKGSIHHPGRVTIPWTTPPAPGHYCLQAALHWVDDANPDNNLGQNNVNVAAATSPATFAFQLRNALARPSRYTFTVDTYRLPELDPCAEVPRPRESRAARIRRIAAEQASGNMQVPPGWSIQITPDTPTLQPGQEITVQVAITPPATFFGEQAFNVNAFAEGTFAGGVTLVATRA